MNFCTHTRYIYLMEELDSIYPTTAGWVRSFLYAPRSTTLEFTSLALEYLKKRILLPRFWIEPSKVIYSASKHSGTFSEFASTRLTHNGVTYQASRLIRKDPDSSFGSGVFVSRKQHTEKTFFIEGGEDPRLFLYQNSIWVYWQRPNSDFSDTQIFVTNIDEQKNYEMRSPFKINGKNWVPFVSSSGNLEFLYSLEPLVILESKELNQELVNVLEERGNKTDDEFEWGDERNSFGKVRGGSPLIPIGNSEYLGFTHLTYRGKLKESHTVGVYIFDENKRTIKHQELTRIRHRTLMDPYGASLKGDVVYIQGSLTTGNPVRRTVFGYDFELEYPIDNLKILVKKGIGDYKNYLRRSRRSRINSNLIRFYHKTRGVSGKIVRKLGSLRHYPRHFIERNARREFKDLRLEDLVESSKFESRFARNLITEQDWCSEIVSESRFLENNFFMWMNFLKEKPKLHSKQFQYYAILETANKLLASKSQPRGIGFGVGNEPIPSALVALGFEIVATDYLDGEIAGIWQETGQLVTSSKKLNERGIATDTLFSRNLTFENLDMNRIPPSYFGEFDFCWSTCALGHIGSYQKGLDFILASALLLKPGGWAVHSTELDLSKKVPLDTPNLSLYREEDLLNTIEKLRAQGFLVRDFKGNNWQAKSEAFVTEEPWEEKPHIRIKVLQREIVSSLIIFQRPNN